MYFETCPDTGKKIMVVTNSAMSKFRDCRYDYFLYYQQLLTPKVQSPALEDGSVWHNCLEGFYMKHKPKQIFQKMREDYAEYMSNPKVRITEYMRDEYFARMYTLMGMGAGYFKRYARDLKEWRFTVPGRKGYTLEIPFRIKLFENDEWIVYNEGKLDGLGFHLKSKQWWIWEHKSAQRIDQATLNKLPMDGQCLNYMWAGGQILKSFGIKDQVQGVVYNVTKKSSLRRKKKTKNIKAETKKAYIKRVQEDYIKRPDFYFMRQRVRFDSRRLLNYEKDITRLSKNMIEAIENPKKHMYKNYAQCTRFGQCAFMSICIQGSLDGPHMKYFYTRDAQHQELVEDKEK